jgi:hypothetical protein
MQQGSSMSPRARSGRAPGTACTLVGRHPVAVHHSRMGHLPPGALSIAVITIMVHCISRARQLPPVDGERSGLSFGRRATDMSMNKRGQ